ncbi:L,D-transpeptidase [Microbaculum sp. FT89]|uniref:L,D-transpeptidase n=1 Tax=Microbaculum sp. FT89 TaxID=3447298 RepID=UPI003F5386E5
MSAFRKWTASFFLIVAGALTILAAEPATAGSVSVRIDISEQRMHVSVGGRPAYTWKVSTARRGYRTPIGNFRPKRLERTWYSTRYNGSPMPNSIFFYGGYAIHGTYEVRNLGRPVSHGCVRLAPQNARTLFDLVLKHGRGSTLITVVR